MSGKNIDAWVDAGIPLLPASLRSKWSEEELPGWVKDELGLEPNATFNALDASIWNKTRTALSHRLRNFLLNLVRVRRGEIRDVNVFVDQWPYWLNPKKIRFSTRTRNCLEVSGLSDDPQRISRITFGQLFEIRAMGVASILEFSCLSEAEINKLGETHKTEDMRSFSTDDLLDIIYEPWVDQVGADDPRFSDLLPPFDGSILERIDALTNDPDSDEVEAQELADAIPSIKERVSEIAELSLEGSLINFFSSLSRFDGARLAALFDRFGWGGSPPTTLEAAGSRIGITRERVRQLQARVTHRLFAIPFQPYLPALDAALAEISNHAPLTFEEAAELLEAKKISSLNFDPRSLIAAAEACGRTPSIRLQSVRGKTIVVTSDIPNADGIIRTAYHQAEASGVSNIQEVVSELSSKGVDLEEEEVRNALARFSQVEFLEDDWFCYRKGKPDRDRLRNVSHKMLSVAAPMELAVLREGVRREFRYRGYRGLRTWPLIVPPRSMLKSYFEGHSEFEILSDSLVSPVSPLDYRSELALNERILVDALRSTPACVLERASFWKECTRRHMNENTFSIYLSYSPVIVHYGVDIWSLRGVHVDPAAIEAVRSANALRPKEKRVLDHGWSPEGHLWLAARLPARHAGFVLGVPSAIRQYIVGREFPAKDENGQRFGNIRISHEGASYGFGSFLRQRGADQDDLLLIEFDLVNCDATLRLGDEEILDVISPET